MSQKFSEMKLPQIINKKILSNKSLNIFLSLTVTSSCLFMAGCGSRETPSEIVYAGVADPYHRVQEGETLSSIAEQHQMSEDELAALNHITMPYQVIPGQLLQVNVKSGTQGMGYSDGKGGVKESPLPGQQQIGQQQQIQQPPAMGIMSGSLPQQNPNQGMQQDGMAPQQGTEQYFGGTTPYSTNQAGQQSGQQYGNPQAMNQPDMGTGTMDGGTMAGGATSQATGQGKAMNTARPTQTYQWPVNGEIIQPKSGKSTSGGVNIKAPAKTPVRPIADGTVIKVSSQIPALGKMIVIKHNDGKISIYAHLQDILVKPEKGKNIVTKETIIGRVGSTGGDAHGVSQLLLIIRAKDKKTPINPETLLPGQ